jgi:Tfp pilus assembly protein FimT
VRRRLIGIAAALALGVSPAVAVATPALASVHVCTKYGNRWCLDASSLAAGTPITNGSPGRDIILQDQGFTHQGTEVYRLVFALDTSKCVGFSSNGLAEVRDCSGNSNYTNWDNVRFTSDGTTIWVNNSFNLASCTTQNRAGDYSKFTPSPFP